MTQTILLVGCGKSKGSQAVRAGDLYTGSLFRARARYAESRDCVWYVLSARHGVIDPDVQIHPYDLSIKFMSPIERRSWGVGVVGQVLDTLPSDCKLNRLDVEVHAGADYYLQFRDIFRVLGIACRSPVEGLSQGKQMKWYSQQLEKLGSVSV